jgi:hypothetical protein
LPSACESPPLGKLVSKTTTGTAAADPPSDITDPTPLEYPRAAVPVGGIWTKSQAISGLGTMVARLRLVAVGTAQGQQTATITIAANQPMRLTSNGLAFSGTLAAAGRQTVFVQTGADVSSSHLAMSVRGVMAGTVNGVKITGTMTMSFSQDSVPQS